MFGYSVYISDSWPEMMPNTFHSRTIVTQRRMSFQTTEGILLILDSNLAHVTLVQLVIFVGGKIIAHDVISIIKSKLFHDVYLSRRKDNFEKETSFFDVSISTNVKHKIVMTSQ